MSMSSRDWAGLATVYQAGADAQRGYIYNPERQQQADSLEAMAVRCEQLAAQGDMDGEQLGEAQRAERQRRIPQGSRVKCQVFVREDSGRSGLCVLHRDHVLDDTPHTLGEEPRPRGPLLPS